MPDSPNLWDAFAIVIDLAPTVPLDVDGRPILGTLDSQGVAWPRFWRGQTEARETDQGNELPPPGYVLFGQTFETEAGCYNGEAGQDGLYRFGCWARTPDDAERLYRWFKRLFHEVPLVVEGYEPVTGILSKSGPSPDPQGTGWQVEASYRAEPFEAAA